MTYFHRGSQYSKPWLCDMAEYPPSHPPLLLSPPPSLNRAGTSESLLLNCLLLFLPSCSFTLIIHPHSSLITTLRTPLNISKILPNSTTMYYHCIFAIAWAESTNLDAYRCLRFGLLKEYFFFYLLISQVTFTRSSKKTHH